MQIIYFSYQVGVLAPFLTTQKVVEEFDAKIISKWEFIYGNNEL